MSQLYVDNIKNRTGGAIGAPSGAVVTGILTATNVSASSSITAASFYGDGRGLIGVASTDNIITGTAATFTGGIGANEINVTGIITAQSGIRVGAGQSISPVSGIITYYGDGSNLTGIEVGLTTEALVANNSVVTLDLTAAQDHKITATGICTITVTGGTESDSHTVRLINSGIATVGFSTYFLFPSGSIPSLPEADGSISLLSFTVNRVGAAGTQLLTGASLNYS